MGASRARLLPPGVASAEEAEALLEALAIPAAEREGLRLQLAPSLLKGGLDPVIPTDPRLDRFNEILQV